ncbi:hypothetical protein BGZ47_007755 [Haplosporangium gracile]|nr:hypothetical protein BGZ47_007755 [Haplosporangium gracile]
MAPASETFFPIPELVHNLAPYLTSQDLLQLLRTNRNNYTAFTPYFWTDVTINTSNAIVRLMESPEACEALYRNIGFIRFLRTKADFLLFYIEDSTPTSTRDRMSFYLTQFISAAPQLLGDVSTAALDLGLSMCWFISLNRGLTHLTLLDEPLKGHHLGRVFARTASRLPCLRQLRFSCMRNMASSTFRMILLTCPLTLEPLQGYNYLNDYNEKYGLDLYNSMEMDEEGPLEVRQEPLYRLTRLRFPWHMLGYEVDQLVQMMKVCPNVEAWDVPLTRGEGPLGKMAVAVKDLWPRLRELTAKVVHFDSLGQGVLPIMEKIDMNQLQALEHLEIGGAEAIRIKFWLEDMDPEVP